MAACKTKHRGMFVVGDPRTNKGKMIKRKPIKTTLTPVRTLFEHMDARRIPYNAIAHRICRENLNSYRSGQSGLSLYTLIEWADALGFDIVAVPRGQVDTPATPQPAGATQDRVGTAVPGAGSPLPQRAAAGAQKW